MALADDILADIDSGTLNDIAQQVGVEPDKLQSIIRDSLPALLGGMEKNVQSGEGAASLANALGQHADANPLGDMGALINGALGSGIIEKVLGGAAPNVSEAIGSKAGASGVDVEKILKIVAPIVMAYLAKRLTSGGKADPADVQKEVQNASTEAKAQSPDLGSILGSIFGAR
ncbi:DUF937 domain-containing protein [Aeromicrobium ginsengisoli]|uniref:DUF937 domain-containing protein n=1 Tax=Aeromicrobium ginsengisoli TaxID=363867 RepID=A0A5M4FCM9_9ACTN|nr:DUF937 domain-containing protein [Aeromicrobium ginsengisoli]KAA1396116.1 DUF937 domain-containing protein [Aeromicrobium ginsengisoli]